MKETIAKLVEIPRITDPRGNLAVIEKEVIPYAIKRVYYLHDVPSGAYRGGHSHKECKELLIAISGSFEVILDNGVTKERVTLNKPNQGLLIDIDVWRELENFSSAAVCLVLASHEYDEEDYVRDYQEFLHKIDLKS